jgi:hypothetical protein
LLLIRRGLGILLVLLPLPRRMMLLPPVGAAAAVLCGIVSL